MPVSTVDTWRKWISHQNKHRNLLHQRNIEVFQWVEDIEIKIASLGRDTGVSGVHGIGCILTFVNRAKLAQLQISPQRRTNAVGLEAASDVQVSTSSGDD